MEFAGSDLEPAGIGGGQSQRRLTPLRDSAAHPEDYADAEVTNDNHGRGKRLWIRHRVATLAPPLMPDEVIAGKVPRKRVIAAFEATVRALEPSEFEAVIPAEAFLATSLGTGPVQLADSAVPVLDGLTIDRSNQANSPKFIHLLLTLTSVAGRGGDDRRRVGRRTTRTPDHPLHSTVPAAARERRRRRPTFPGTLRTRPSANYDPGHCLP